MKRNRLDIRDRMPSGMDEYLSQNGWHFNKKLCEWAVSKMWKKDAAGKKIPVQVTPREALQQLFKTHNINIENNVGYDCMFVYHMAKSDFLGSSLPDEKSVAKYVKDYIDDPDGYDGLPMTRFYADCIGSGTPIMWEDML